MLGIVLAREGVGLGVEHEMDVAVYVECDILGTMTPRAPESKRVQQIAERCGRCIVDGEFDKSQTVDGGWRGRTEELDASEDACALTRRGRREPRSRFLLEKEERAHTVQRGSSIRRLAKHIVEDFEPKRAAVSGDQHLLEKVCEIELTLSGEAAVMAAPLQHVHRESRRIGELQEKDPLAGNVGDAGGLVAEREDVEAVEHQAEVRVIGFAHDRESIRIMAHVLAPGERLVGDAQPAIGGALGQRS